MTLDVADGELLVVVGPSGCGKSTLLRLLAGLEEPTSGWLRIGDRVVNDLPPQARNVAMVFQDYALYPHMTVRGNLEFPLRMRGAPRREIRSQVEQVAGLLGMGDWLDRLPRQLSGGQQQRVAMGRALVREPVAFLMDEPLSNLDAQLRVEVRDEIARLQRRTGTTMLYVTHDQTEAMTLGDRVAVLGDGHLQQVAPAREVYDHPANVFVAGFVGSPPMNLFPSRLQDGGDTIDLAGHPVSVPAELAASVRQRDASDAPLTGGVRPEALRLGDAGAGSPVPGRVRHVELLGHEALVHVEVGAEGRPPTELTVRLPGMEAPARGETVALRIDPGSLYLFDGAGRAVEGPGA